MVIKKTRKNSTKKMGLSASDYRKILKFYKLSIPKKVSNLRKKGDKIIAKKFCSCIKKVRKKFKKEGIAIGICTKSVITRKGIKRGSFNCKSKTSIDLYKGGSKRSTKKKMRKKRGAGGVFSCKRCGNKKDKKEEADYYEDGMPMFFSDSEPSDSEDDDLPEWFRKTESVLQPMEHFQTLSLVHGNDKRPTSPFLPVETQEEARISPILSLGDKEEGFGQFVNIEKWKGGRKKTRKKRGGVLTPEEKKRLRERLEKAKEKIKKETEKLQASKTLNTPIKAELPARFSPITVPTKKGGRKRSTKKNRKTRKK